MNEYVERRRGRIKGSYFVSAETGLTFPDFSRMHLYRRQDQRVRKMETPIWSVRDDLLRKLLVTYLENRFFITPPTTLTLLERLHNARGAALHYAPYKKELLKQWVQEHKRISAVGLDGSDEEVTALYQLCPEHNGQLPMDADYARAYMRVKSLLGLEKQIQILDTDLVLTQRGHAEVIVAVVYLFYRMGWDSVEVAEHLSLKPPHIRQVLARMHNTWLSHFADELGVSSKDVGGSLQRYSPDEPESTDASAGRTLDAPPFAYLWDNL